MIEIKNLGKNYAGVWALEETSWSLAKNRTLGLLGPNGAGKSTTMKLMTGLLAPSTGAVFIEGQNVSLHPKDTKSKIGYLPETPPLYEELTVGAYLDFVAGLKGLGKSERLKAVPLALEKLQLEAMELKPISHLSKGFRQRVGIAQALVANPQILVLDEPSVGLDPQQVVELRNVIKSLKSDHTIILSTHVLSEVEQVCDDVVILDSGRVKAFGPMDKILQRRNQRFGLRIGIRKESQGLMEKIKGLSGVASVDYSSQNQSLEIFSEHRMDDIDPFIRLALDAQVGVVDVERLQMGLEDAYMHFTSDEVTP